MGKSIAPKDALSLAACVFLRRRVPLAVSWALTYRCTNKCRYCGLWCKNMQELSTDNTFKIIGEMRRAGVRWISFTGGEPLLRDDLGEILDYVNSQGIFISINTNGFLVPSKEKELAAVDDVHISLDGRRDVHDFLRGQGTYDSALNAILFLKDRGKQVKIVTVISRHNLNDIDFILELARKLKVRIQFQTATVKILGTGDNNACAPATEENKKAVEKIIAAKRAGQDIFNSFAGLDYLKHYPGLKMLNCAAGFMNCDLEPDGTMLCCDRYPLKQNRVNVLAEGFTEGFKKLSKITACRQCWCAARLEFNYAFSFKPEPLYNLWRQFIG